MFKKPVWFVIAGIIAIIIAIFYFYSANAQVGQKPVFQVLRLKRTVNCLSVDGFNRFVTIARWKVHYQGELVNNQVQYIFKNPNDDLLLVQHEPKYDSICMLGIVKGPTKKDWPLGKNKFHEPFDESL